LDCAKPLVQAVARSASGNVRPSPGRAREQTICPAQLRQLQTQAPRRRQSCRCCRRARSRAPQDPSRLRRRGSRRSSTTAGPRNSMPPAKSSRAPNQAMMLLAVLPSTPSQAVSRPGATTSTNSKAEADFPVVHSDCRLSFSQWPSPAGTDLFPAARLSILCSGGFGAKAAVER